jgi:hypothetical protein
MNQQQADELTQLIKEYADTCVAIDRARTGSKAARVKADQHFEEVRLELSTMISELTS